jgi:hypothetical protein
LLIFSDDIGFHNQNLTIGVGLVDLDSQIPGFRVSGGDFAFVHAALFVAVTEFDLYRVESGEAVGLPENFKASPPHYKF